MGLSIKNKRLLQQCLPFVIIWGIFGSLYVILEYGILGRTKFYPVTSNPYSAINNTLFVVPSSLLMGFIQGILEVKFFKSRFQNASLVTKLLSKSIIYLVLTILFLIGLAFLNATRTNYTGPLGHDVIMEVTNFFTSFSFWSVVIYCGVGITFAQLISEIRSASGPEIFHNFLFGKYFRPIEEDRIFMFLDMKGSTTLAESMGHTHYFELLRTYYADMTTAIIDTKATIYQYVGDEIVLTWTKTDGLENNNCIECFFKIQKTLEDNKANYMNRFDHFPEFKAGLHMGTVTTGEIGVIKKDIVYTGDVLNTAARMQNQCNIYDSKFIVSKAITSELAHSNGFQLTHLGELSLKGKRQRVELYDLRKN